MSRYVDVHAHLTDPSFDADRESLLAECVALGLGAIVCNGTDPDSNRQVLALAARWPVVFAALGIYPVDAAAAQLASATGGRGFSLGDELAFIESEVAAGRARAIGECGLDGYQLGESTFAAQERVLEQLLDIAVRYDVPAILHSRKREKRTLELVAALGVRRADFHCYSGKTKWAVAAAEAHPEWCFSLPANIARNEAHQKLARELPGSALLTETDAPYLAPVRGERSDPRLVPLTCGSIARLRGMGSPEAARALVWQNFQRLFAPPCLLRAPA